jgi:2-oxoacid:acceptor oxidoreductase gamma subunit (pyruvate/2-ketoisovalerate family)
MAAGMLASALVHEGKYATAVGSFGPERRGAPVTSFLRFDEKPIRQNTRVYHPDCLVVIDPRLVYTTNIFDGLKKDSFLVMNAPKVDENLNLPNVAVLGIVDATKIGLEEIGAAITNTCMMGAFARTTGWLQLDSLLVSLEQRFSGKVLEKNIKVIKRGFEEVNIINIK